MDETYRKPGQNYWVKVLHKIGVEVVFWFHSKENADLAVARSRQAPEVLEVTDGMI